MYLGENLTVSLSSHGAGPAGLGTGGQMLPSLRREKARVFLEIHTAQAKHRLGGQALPQEKTGPPALYFE
jgi:hypothetical protein